MITLLASTPYFYVIHKDVGQSFHSENHDEGVIELLEKQTAEELFMVHRLDKLTSGLLVVARTQEAQRDLNTLFEERKVEKFYLALSRSKPKKKQGTVIGDMQRSRRASWKLLHTKKNPAVTQFFSYGSPFDGSSVRLFVIRLCTGKTHQIRVALKSLGAAISGDPIYNNQESSTQQRMYLHSYALDFTLYGEHYSFLNFPTSDSLWEQSALQSKKEELCTPLQLPWPQR